MNKAIFLDRDGTINRDKGYIFQREDIVWLPGAIEALKFFSRKGFKLIIITNQSGIARGYYSENDFLKLNDWMLNELKRYNVFIDKVYFCPHHPEGCIAKYAVNCKCRKPKTLLFEKAAEEFDIGLKNSYAIGDKIRDCSICFQSECKGILIEKNEREEIINEVKNGKFGNIRYAKSLYDCINLLKEEI